MARNHQQKFSLRLIRGTIDLLPGRKKAKLVLFGFQSLLLNILDMLGVALVGTLLAVFVALQIEDSQANLPFDLTSILGFSNFETNTKLLSLSVIITCLFVLKSLLSILFHRNLYNVLKDDMNRLGRILAKDLIEGSGARKLRTVSSDVQILNDGLQSMFFGVLASFLLLASDLGLILLLLVSISIFSPVTSISLVLSFGIIGLTLSVGVGNKTQVIGSELSVLRAKLSDLLLFSINSRKELVAAGKADLFVENFSALEIKLHSQLSKAYFLPNVGKYLLEASLVFGMFLVGILQFVFLDKASAIMGIFIFLVASLRIAPAVLRLQQSWLQMRHHSGLARSTLDDIEFVKSVSEDFDLDTVDRQLEFIPRIEIKNLRFNYPTHTFDFFIEKLIVEEGSYVALVGTSGAGKTTLIDMVLGLLEPSSGEVLISGVHPKNARVIWPGKIAYVPQDIYLINGDISKNVTLFDKEVDENRLSKVLRAVGLEKISNLVIDHSPEEDSPIRLSGGQIQRIGIARALYQEPKLLILDEATSSLDSETETLVTDLIQNLKGEVTVMVIAHRLSTIQSADLVAYIEQGRILGVGKFDVLRSQIPDLENQARILGI